jgi:hypothetical protein
MSIAALQVRLVPKRMLDKKEAAAYCGLTPKRFDVECPVQPVRYANGELRWDVRELDAWLDGLKAGSVNDDLESIIERLGKK